MHVLLMGPCGSGKTTVGEALSLSLSCPFFDADSFHSAASKAKMALGQPLNDSDRAPWLASIAQRMQEEHSAGRSCVFSCSALKLAYRDTLRAAMPPGQMRCFLLLADARVLAARLSARAHPFMNPTLLASQLATLEIPHSAEHASVIDCTSLSVAQVVEAVQQQCKM